MRAQETEQGFFTDCFYSLYAQVAALVRRWPKHADIIHMLGDGQCPKVTVGMGTTLSRPAISEQLSSGAVLCCAGP